MKKRIVSAFCAAAFLLFAGACQTGKVFDYGENHPSVSVAVQGPDGATVLEEVRVSFGEGATILDCTLYALQKQKIAYEVVGVGASAYMRGIGEYYEGDRGSGSGWLYSVNGGFEAAGVSCGVYEVKDGDRIVWHYTLNYGKDVGAVSAQ